MRTTITVCDCLGCKAQTSDEYPDHWYVAEVSHWNGQSKTKGDVCPECAKKHGIATLLDGMMTAAEERMRK